MLRRAALVGLAVALCSCAPAAAAPCPPVAYPGDSAAKAALAAWMAGGAGGAGLPGELPVMGALVESELQNLPEGDGDSVGFFQMRTSIWDQGQYAGFPTNPELQLKWFVDQSLAAEFAYPTDPTRWGEWAADVLRPPAQYRYRYQLRLDEARALIGACSGAGPTPPAVDSAAPVVSLLAKRVQDPLRQRAIVVEAACPLEACVAVARGALSLPRAARVHRFRSSATQIPGGGKAKLKLRVGSRARRAIRRALARHRRLTVRITVTATDAADNASTARRTVALKRRR
jgi:hypothetical protein